MEENLGWEADLVRTHTKMNAKQHATTRTKMHTHAHVTTHSSENMKMNSSACQTLIRMHARPHMRRVSVCHACMQVQSPLTKQRERDGATHTNERTRKQIRTRDARTRACMESRRKRLYTCDYRREPIIMFVLYARMCLFKQFSTSETSWKETIWGTCCDCRCKPSCVRSDTHQLPFSFLYRSQTFLVTFPGGIEYGTYACTFAYLPHAYMLSTKFTCVHIHMYFTRTATAC